MQRPSSVQVWQIPPATVFPTPELAEADRSLPLEEQETSYLAASPRIASFSMISTPHLPHGKRPLSICLLF
jgi:hypothetical protein